MRTTAVAVILALVSVDAGAVPAADMAAVASARTSGRLVGSVIAEANDLLEAPDLRGADLAESSLDAADLQGAYMGATSLAESDLGDANLQTAYLADANLVKANLAAANLQEADLSGADLRGADLAGAILQGANLAGALLEGANLENAQLQGASLAGARGLSQDQLDSACADRTLDLRRTALAYPPHRACCDTHDGCAD